MKPILIRPDEDTANADWTKKTWDLPTDPNEFRAFLTASGRSLEQFMQLPAAKAMPPKLRRALGVE